MAKKKRFVVVEGYTDVIAMHIAGEETAVATCGTAFGPDHIRVVRRIIGDAATGNAGVLLSSGQAVGGEIIFTLDRKSTRLNSSHVAISYAVFCLKKKQKRT